jgi:hypothetical protein
MGNNFYRLFPDAEWLQSENLGPQITANTYRRTSAKQANSSWRAGSIACHIRTSTIAADRLRTLKVKMPSKYQKKHCTQTQAD